MAVARPAPKPAPKPEEAGHQAHRDVRWIRATWSRSVRAVRTAASAFAIVVVTIGVVLVAVTARRGAETRGTETGGTETGLGPPVGLFQSESPVGAGPVGANTCVALRLTDDAYRTGSVTVWWWVVGPAGCRSSTSGVVSAPARLTSAPLSATSDLPARVGYRIDLDLELVPSGSETITFTLDPTRSNPGSQAIIAYKGTDTSGSAFEFAPVVAVSVDEPGPAPPPTPRQP